MDNHLLNFEKNDALDDYFTHKSDYEKIHIRIQKRNGKKCITIIEGLDVHLTKQNISGKSVLKNWKKNLNCNGSIKKNPEDKNSLIFQLTGDHKKNIKDYLINIIKIDSHNIITHG